jgi:transcriptional regulator with XRE-family HTH domain
VQNKNLAKQDNIKMPLNRSLESSFGLVLRRLRQNCGFSQEKLGFESGYHRTYISLLERGQKSPSLQTIFKLAKALDVEPSEIVEHVQAVTKPRSRKKR